MSNLERKLKIIDHKVRALKEQYQGRAPQDVLLAAQQMSLADRTLGVAEQTLKALRGGDEQKENAARAVGFGALKSLQDNMSATIEVLQAGKAAMPQDEFREVRRAGLNVGVTEQHFDFGPTVPSGMPANFNGKGQRFIL